MRINIGGTVHDVRRAGETRCGRRYPPRWQTTGRAVSCEECDQLSGWEHEANLKQMRAQASAWLTEEAGPDIPF